jgi:signal transduction histidine kinase/CheY-like chemotaxis protein
VPYLFFLIINHLKFLAKSAENQMECKIFMPNLITTYLNNWGVIGDIKHTARKIEMGGVQLRLSDGSGKMIPFPSSPLSFAGFALHRTGMLDKADLISYFLGRVNSLLNQITDEIGPGIESYLDLKSALKQFLSASSGLNPNESDQLLDELLLEAVRTNIDTPAERALAEKYNKIMQIVVSQNSVQGVKEVCQFIVDLAKESFDAANPSIMLYEEDKQGQGFLVPTAVAMTKSARLMGERLRGKKLGEHRIPVSPKSLNIYVEKFMEAQDGEIINCGRLTADEYIKVSGNFIDAKIEKEGIYWALFLTAKAFFPEDNNTLLMIPLTVKDGNGGMKKIGIFAVLRKGGFSKQELREIQLFSQTAASVIQAKQNQLYLIEANLRLQQMQDQLVKDARVKAMGKIAGIASHTFKNLLSGSVGLNEEQRESLNRVLALLEIVEAKSRMGMSVGKETESLSSLLIEISHLVDLNQQVLYDGQAAVRQMLSLARKGSEVRAVVPLKKYFKERLALYSLLAKAKHVEFKVETKGLENNDGVFMIEEDLGDILGNLIKNSIEAFDQFEPQGPKEVVVSARREDESIVISVKDNGQGISRERLSTIFASQETTKLEGTGLGMVTVKKKVEDHNGFISVESELAVGTKIEIWFPRMKVDPAKESDPPHERVDINQMRSLTKDKCVVLVEDDVLLCEVQKNSLRRWGFKEEKIMVFQRADEALTAIYLNAFIPDLIISDQTLPTMKGHELLLKVDRFYKEQGIDRPGLIIHSGNIQMAKDDPVGKAIAQIGVQWVEKGSGSDVLQNAVAQILKGKVVPSSLQRQSNPILSNPLYQFLGRIVHKVNNSLFLFMNMDGFGQEDVIGFGKRSIKDLLLFLEGLRKFAEAAQPRMIEKQRDELFKEFDRGNIDDGEFKAEYKSLNFEDHGIDRLNDVLRDDVAMKDIWQTLKGSRVKLAVACEYYLSQVADVKAPLEKLLSKEQWGDEDFAFLKQLVASNKLTLGISQSHIPNQISTFCDELNRE